LRRKRRSVGGRCIAGESSDLRQKKQSFPCGLQGFPAEVSLSPRYVGLECLRAHSEHPDDAAAAPIRKLGRIFRHAQQSNTERFAPKVSQNRSRTKNRDGGGERCRVFGRRNLSALSGRPRAIATEIRDAD